MKKEGERGGYLSAGKEGKEVGSSQVDFGLKLAASLRQHFVYFFLNFCFDFVAKDGRQHVVHPAIKEMLSFLLQ